MEYNHPMYAADAHYIAKKANKPVDTWTKLFNRIQEEAEKGKFVLQFNERDEKVRFEEHRKEVKKKLEELGYSVSYRRDRYVDPYIEEWYNIYHIEW